ncbi:MAG: filamentous hemagglutinin N-terminal domain-containing protein [Cyanobacteria bacterium P01_D01_bin.1]
MFSLPNRIGPVTRAFLYHGCAIAPLLASQLIAPAVAQSIDGDGSLSTIVTASDNLDFTITAGEQQGTNLFHSFSSFSVPTGGSAVFKNPTDILNVISRVTGSASTIDGTIETAGAANLFLINPQGIVFGPNAQLNIDGSFIGTTASSISFKDGTVFTATELTPSPLLTVSAPAGLQMGALSGDISIAGLGYTITRNLDFSVTASGGSELQVGADNTLAFIGRNVSLSDAYLSTSAGQVELGSVGAGNVEIVPNAQSWQFDYSESTDFGDLRLHNSLVEAIGVSGGQLQLRGGDIWLQQDSQVFIQNTGIQPSAGITVHAEDDLIIQGVDITKSTGIGTAGSSLTTEGLFGTSGDINVSARRLAIEDGAGLFSRNLIAPGSDIIINATDSVELIPSANFTANVDSLTVGPFQAGDVVVNTDWLRVLEGSKLSSITYGTGNSGNVTVNDALLIEVSGVQLSSLIPSLIGSTTLGLGNAGNVKVETEQLNISAGGRVDSSTATSGNAGSVTIDAETAVTVSGRVANSINPSLIASSATLLDESLRTALDLPPAPTGDAGDVLVTAPLLQVLDGAQVAVRNQGGGSGGTLRTISDTVILRDGAGLIASTLSGGGGNIDLQANSVLLSRAGSLISAEAGGAGDGGNVELETPFLVALEDSDIVANAFQGVGGDVLISAQIVLGTEFRDRLTPQSDITASSQFGTDGTVTLDTPAIGPDSGTVELPSALSGLDQQVAAGCSQQQGNQFITSGRGGMPTSPTNNVGSNRPWQDLRVLPALAGHQMDAHRSRSNQSADSEPNRVQEATGWQQTQSGQVELIATDLMLSSGVATASCLANRTT